MSFALCFILQILILYMKREFSSKESLTLFTFNVRWSVEISSHLNLVDDDKSIFACTVSEQKCYQVRLKIRAGMKVAVLWAVLAAS
jgi:hypothetical protein